MGTAAGVRRAERARIISIRTLGSPVPTPDSSLASTSAPFRRARLSRAAVASSPSVVAAAVVAPQVLIQVASGLTTPIEVVGKWCNEMWNKYEKAVKIQIELVSKVEAGAKVNNVATENIRFEVEQLRIKILFILNTIEIAVEEEEEVSTRLAMQEIMKKVDGLTDKIEEVGESAAKCSKLIGYGRFLVLQHILGLPTNSGNLPLKKNHQWGHQSC